MQYDDFNAAQSRRVSYCLKINFKLEEPLQQQRLF
jgi:hypothetical protein